MASAPRDSHYEGYDSHISQYLATRDKSHLQAAFRLIDLNGDGFISRVEMITFLRALGAQRESARERMLEIFRNADSNKDGVLDVKEFEKVIRSKDRRLSGQKAVQPVVADAATREQEVQRLLEQYAETNDSALLEGIFKLVDLDSNGSISQAELQASFLLKEATDKQTAASMLLSLGDLNSDGALNVEEFVTLIHQ